MNNIYSKSIVYGVLLGTLLLVIAPLGLGILIVEILRPILAPGALIAQVIIRDGGAALLLMVSLLLNWSIFSALFFGYFYIRRDTKI